MPFCDVAGAHSPVFGMAFPLVYKGTLMEGFVERFTGRVDGRIQIDHGGNGARIRVSGYNDDPSSGCFDLGSTTLMIR